MWTLSCLICAGNTLYCLIYQTSTFTTSSATVFSRHTLALVPVCGTHTTELSHHTHPVTNQYRQHRQAADSWCCRGYVLLRPHLLSLTGSARLLNNVLIHADDWGKTPCQHQCAFIALCCLAVIYGPQSCVLLLWHPLGSTTRRDTKPNVIFQCAVDIYMAEN